MRALVLVSFVLAACRGASPATPAATPSAAPAAPAAPADLAAPQSFVVAPGTFAELNAVLPAGAAAARFTADGALHWNIHSHPGETPVIHAEGDGAEGTLGFVPDAPGPYSWMWENRGTTAVTLTITPELAAGSRIDSWHPAPRPAPR